MKCPQCFWQNAKDAQQCLMCRTALSATSSFSGAGAKAEPKVPPKVAAAVQAVPPTNFGTPSTPTPFVHLASDVHRVLAALIDVAQIVATIYVWLKVVWAFDVSMWLSVAGVIVLLYLPAILDIGPGSLGKQALKIQTVTQNGVAPSLLRSMWRHTMKHVLHLLMPVLWKLIEGLITGGRHLHDIWAGTVVIERVPANRMPTSTTGQLSHEILIQQLQPRQVSVSVSGPTPITRKDIAHAKEKNTAHTKAKAVGQKLVLYGLGLLFAVALVQVIWEKYQESNNPSMSAVLAAHKATKPLTDLLSRRYVKDKGLAIDWSASEFADIKADMDAVFSDITMDADGLITLELKATPVTGKHIAVAPQFRFLKTSIKQWNCGSPDIEPDLLPRDCNMEMYLLRNPE